MSLSSERVTSNTYNRLSHKAKYKAGVQPSNQHSLNKENLS